MRYACPIPNGQNGIPAKLLMLRPQSFGLEIPWGRPLCICHLTTRHLICFLRSKVAEQKEWPICRQGDNVEAGALWAIGLTWKRKNLPDCGGEAWALRLLSARSTAIPNLGT